VKTKAKANKIGPTMAPERKTKRNDRLIRLRESMGMTQAAFAEKYFRVHIATYQRWETKSHDELPGMAQVIIEALQNGGRLPK
jgi:DNA-binding transcriptional regulator YiaG